MESACLLLLSMARQSRVSTLCVGSTIFCARGRYFGYAESIRALKDRDHVHTKPGAAVILVDANRPEHGGPAQVLDYLGRYTHRVAISNERILDIGADTVSVRVRDSAHGNRRRTLRAAGADLHRALLAARAAQGLQAHPPLRPARPGRQGGETGTGARSALGATRPIRSWWSRSRPSCTASSGTSACAARTAAMASSCPPHPLRRCRCACCICGDRRDRCDCVPDSCVVLLALDHARGALGPLARFARYRRSLALVRGLRYRSWSRQCLRAPPRAPSSSCQTIALAAPAALTIPITTARAAVQSNEVYPPPSPPRQDSTFAWRRINAIR